MSLNLNKGRYWPTAIICPEHGQVFVDMDEYLYADEPGYRCPRCGAESEFDWDNYNDYQDYLDSVLPGGLQGACR